MTPTLRVHALVPRSVPIGGDRQLRVQVSDGPAISTAPEDERLHVAFRSDDRRFSVRPAGIVLARADLATTRFALAARVDLTCDTDPDGSLEISVRSLLDPQHPAVVQVPLPDIDCRTAPPVAPDSVHLLEPVCGDDRGLQVRRLLDGERLDPRRCARHRWHEGNVRPWPPPRPAPTPAPTPPQAAPPPDDVGDVPASDDTDDVPTDGIDPDDRPEHDDSDRSGGSSGSDAAPDPDPADGDEPATARDADGNRGTDGARDTDGAGTGNGADDEASRGDANESGADADS